MTEWFRRARDFKNEEDATRLLNDTYQFLDEHDIREFCSNHLALAYIFRGLCRKKRQDWDGCIQDATQCISVITVLKTEQGIGQMSTEQLLQMEFDILTLRAFAHSKKSQWKKAIKDKKAACAILRYYGSASSWVGTGYNIVDAAMDVLAYMAKEKLEQKSARPHFTRKEQDKIMEELGLGVYAESLYCCIPCKTKPSEDVTLSRCSRCLGVWYCSKKCQTIHWKEGGHKECCNRYPITTTILPELERAGIEEEIAVSGYASVCHRTGPAIVVRDFETGELFESLTNQDVYFVDEGVLQAAHANGLSLIMDQWFHSNSVEEWE